ncbi:MAG: helix-turn-helix domain-containing protein [Promethearchaeota archaeon]
MVPHKDENINTSQEKLDEILSSIKELRYHIGILDHRISQLEGHIDQKLSTVTKSVIFQSSVDDEQKTDFDDLDEHLKRTYQTLATAQEPLTASQLAERMGRSRSTTSYHLNKLEKMGVLEKFPSPLKQSSRSILFRPKDRSFELIDSEH